MNIFLALLALIGGFVLLIKGADWFVEGSSSVAKLLKVPAIIIGLTVVAFGTSLPEASVSISSAIAGKNALAVSNVVGSNIFNALVVLGASALIAPVCVLPNSIKKEIPFSILCTVALLVALLLGMKTVVPAVSEGSAAVAEVTYTLGTVGGVVLLAIFAFYMYWQISAALKVRKAGAAEEEGEIKVLSPLKSLIFIVVGIACIILGGDFVVDGASAIAIKFGMSETLAPTIVSVSLIFITAVLTALGIFDKIAKHAGAGTLVPITGFANSVVSPAIDNKAEGWVLGVGAKIFIISGPVILYGTLSGVIYGVIYWGINVFI